MKFKKLLAAVGATALLTGAGLLATTTAASAHTPVITGVATCDTGTGTYSIDWTVTTTNVPGDEVATITDTSATPAGTWTSAIPTTITGNDSFTVTETGIAGSTASASVQGTFTWDDFGPTVQTGDVTLAGDCTVTPPPVSDTATWSIATTPATCTAPGTATASGEHATLPALDETVGAHTATATPEDGFDWAGGQTASLDYTIEAQLDANAPPCYTPPVQNVCESPTSNPLSTDLATGGWTLENGEYVDGGVKLTSSNWSDSYAYHAENFNLSDANNLAFDITADSGATAIILETAAGNIHYEPLYSHPLWTNAAGILPAGGGGQGGPYSATDLSDLQSNPVVTGVYLYFTSGSTEPVSAILHSGSFNCQSQAFDVAPGQPGAIVTTSSKTVTDCTTSIDTVTTTTTTVAYVYDADSNSWVKGEPTVETSDATNDATEAECPTAVTVVTPPTANPEDNPVPPTVQSDALADTGSNVGAAIYVAGGGLAAGLIILAIVFWKRRNQITEQ